MIDYIRKYIDVNLILNVILRYENVPTELRLIVLSYCSNSDYELLIDFIEQKTPLNEFLVLLGKDEIIKNQLLLEIIHQIKSYVCVTCWYDKLLGMSLNYNHVYPPNVKLCVIIDPEDLINKHKLFPSADVNMIINRDSIRRWYEVDNGHNSIPISQCMKVVCKLNSLEFIDHLLVKKMRIIRIP